MNTEPKMSINFANIDNNGMKYSFTLTRQPGENWVEAAQRVIKNTYVLNQVVAYLTYVDNGKVNK